jgi:hypothetical protein
MNLKINYLEQLIESAKLLGLPDEDVKNAQEFLRYNELALCFDTITSQLYEYDIEINNELYILISKIGETLLLSSKEYDFMKELIRDEYNIPKPIKEELSKIIGSLNFQ